MTLLAGTQKKQRQKTEKRSRGDYAEDLALSFFVTKGFQLEQRNFSCKLGEIDLIMRDQDFTVFIEVRYRVSQRFGGALESITPTKQGKLRRTAEYYRIRTKSNDSPCRFDILCVTGNLTRPTYEWIENAF